jgi:hypothetical protein
MQPTLIGLLLAFIALAATFFYFGFLHRDRGYASRAQAGFLVLAFMLIPFVAFVLVQQAGATRRLQAYDIVPLPAIEYAIGITAGQGPVPVWVFGGRVTDASALDFYDDPATRPGWEIGERGATMLILRRDGARLSISASGGRIIYMMMP